MKNKYILVLSIIISMFIIITSFNLVSAAIVLNSPGAGTNWTTTVNLNCTKLINDVPINATNFTIYYNASGGAATVALTTIANDTVNDVHFYSSAFSVTSLTDAATYNFTCQAKNMSNTVANSSGVAGITIEDTIPTCTSGASLITRKNIEQGMTQTLTCACTDVIDSSPTHTRTITQPGATTVAVTSSPYTAKGSDIQKIGQYTFTCLGTDYAGNSVTNTNTFRVDTDDDTNPVVISTLDTSPKRTTTMILIIAGLIIIIGIVAVVFAVINKK